MEIKYIHQDQIKKDKERIERLRRIQQVGKANKARNIKDSEKDKEERKNKGQELSEPVVIQAKEEKSSMTIELTEKASKIADRYEVQNHMMGQNMGHINKLRNSLNNASEKEAIETVAAQQNLKMKKAREAYKNGKNTAKRTEEAER